MSGYSELLTWGEATGRISADRRSQWAGVVAEPRTRARALATLFAAPADPALGDYPSPVPFGPGDPAESASLVMARRAARRGKLVAGGLSYHGPQSPEFLVSTEFVAATRLVADGHRPTVARPTRVAASKGAKKMQAPSETAGDREWLDFGVRSGRFSAARQDVYAGLLAADPAKGRAMIRVLAAGLTPEERAASEQRVKFGDRLAASPPSDNALPDFYDGLADTPPPKGPRPTLFSSGERPAVMASGLDPGLVDQVPWQARQALAKAPTAAAAHEVLERYSGVDGEAMAAWDANPTGPLAADVADYMFRVNDWAMRP